MRGSCSFAAKVRLAQSLGAAAILVGDSPAYPTEPDSEGRERDTLLTMYSPEDTSDLFIPALFVSRSTYLSLLDELNATSSSSSKGIQIGLSQDDDWERPLMDLLLLVLLLPSMLTIATLACHQLGIVRKRRKERARPEMVDSLETRIWTEEGWEKVTGGVWDRRVGAAEGDLEAGATGLGESSERRSESPLQPEVNEPSGSRPFVRPREFFGVEEVCRLE